MGEELKKTPGCLTETLDDLAKRLRNEYRAAAAKVVFAKSEERIAREVFIEFARLVSSYYPDMYSEEVMTKSLGASDG